MHEICQRHHVGGARTVHLRASNGMDGPWVRTPGGSPETCAAGTARAGRAVQFTGYGTGQNPVFCSPATWSRCATGGAGSRSTRSGAARRGNAQERLPRGRDRGRRRRQGQGSFGRALVLDRGVATPGSMPWRRRASPRPRPHDGPSRGFFPGWRLADTESGTLGEGAAAASASGADGDRPRAGPATSVAADAARTPAGAGDGAGGDGAAKTG